MERTPVRRDTFTRFAAGAHHRAGGVEVILEIQAALRSVRRRPAQSEGWTLEQIAMANRRAT